MLARWTWLAQRFWCIGRETFNPLVVGSSPGRPTSQIPVSESWQGFLLRAGFVTVGWFESIEVLWCNFVILVCDN